MARSTVKLFEQIRRDKQVENLSIRELAERHRVHRRTVRQALACAVPPPRKAYTVRSRPAIDPHVEVIDSWLLGNREMPRKQRHTARRIWQRLVAEHGAQVAEVTVSRYAAHRRIKLGLDRVEVMVPQTHPPGAEAEVDFGEFYATIAGALIKVWMFVMRLSHSGQAFHVAFGTQAWLAAGELSCPACGGVLTGWGRARPRRLRGAGGPMRLCPRRSRCTGCGVTPVLLPVTAFLRRADAAGVIVAVLAAKASRRVGFRRIATELARPAETVRGWLRRFAARAEAVRSVFTVWLAAVDADPVMSEPAGGVFADAVTAIAAVAAAVTQRFVLSTVPLAVAAVAISGGRLLARGWPQARVQHKVTLPAGPLRP